MRVSPGRKPCILPGNVRPSLRAGRAAAPEIYPCGGRAVFIDLSPDGTSLRDAAWTKRCAARGSAGLGGSDGFRASGKEPWVIGASASRPGHMAPDLSQTAEWQNRPRCAGPGRIAALRPKAPRQRAGIGPISAAAAVLLPCSVPRARSRALLPAARDERPGRFCLAVVAMSRCDRRGCPRASAQQQATRPPPARIVVPRTWRKDRHGLIVPPLPVHCRQARAAEQSDGAVRRWGRWSSGGQGQGRRFPPRSCRLPPPGRPLPECRS